ncbi:MAG: tripartite tricarboxylate transporter TctB family protein [Geminicoccaceae bacterium]
MHPRNDQGMALNKPQSDQITFEGEEAGAGHAAPTLDLIAAAFLIALSLLVMAASLTLPVPGALTTAPGLLPFLTAASLFVMAILLGFSALNRRRPGVAPDPVDSRNSAEDRGTVLLAVTVALYIAALQVLAFQAFFSVAGVPLVLSAFEPVTILALATLIHLFWRGPLWITVVISISWTLTLSLVFQKIFQIPLPGGF